MLCVCAPLRSGQGKLKHRRNTNEITKNSDIRKKQGHTKKNKKHKEDQGNAAETDISTGKPFSLARYQAPARSDDLGGGLKIHCGNPHTGSSQARPCIAVALCCPSCVSACICGAVAHTADATGSNLMSVEQHYISVPR